MIYIFECGHTSETFKIFKHKPNEWPKKVCSECGAALVNKRITCKCGKTRLIGRTGNEKKAKNCDDCQKLVNRKLQAAWKRNHKSKVNDYIRSDIRRVEHASRNLFTDMKPSPVLVNPFRNPCEQGCNVFSELGTYDNTACCECGYRIAYIGMIGAMGVPEYTIIEHRI